MKKIQRHLSWKLSGRMGYFRLRDGGVAALKKDLGWNLNSRDKTAGEDVRTWRNK